MSLFFYVHVPLDFFLSVIPCYFTSLLRMQIDVKDVGYVIVSFF